MSLYDLLARGYFPKELPSPFTTKPFATITTGTAALPADFIKVADPTASTVKIRASKVCKYSLARGGLLRRSLAMCNPLHYFLLSREVTTNWADILTAAGGTSLSATTHNSSRPAGPSTANSRNKPAQ